MATTLSNGKLITAPTMPPPSGVTPKTATDGICTWAVVGESPDGSILQFAATGPIAPGNGPILTTGNVMIAPMLIVPEPMTLFYQVNVSYTKPSDPLDWTILLEREGAMPCKFVRGNGGGGQ